jgi:hypothetical protein
MPPTTSRIMLAKLRAINDKHGICSKNASATVLLQGVNAWLMDDTKDCKTSKKKDKKDKQEKKDKGIHKKERSCDKRTFLEDQLMNALKEMKQEWCTGNLSVKEAKDQICKKLSKTSFKAFFNKLEKTNMTAAREVSECLLENVKKEHRLHPVSAESASHDKRKATILKHYI